jgi:hypothetical protein
MYEDSGPRVLTIMGKRFKMQIEQSFCKHTDRKRPSINARTRVGLLIEHYNQSMV